MEKNNQNDNPLKWMPKSLEFILEEEETGIIMKIDKWPYHISEKYKIKFKNIYEEEYKKIEFDENLFNEIYEYFNKLNYNKIFLQSALMIAHGERNDLTIKISLGHQKLSFKICSYEHNIKERGLLEINKITKKLLKICNYNELF